MDKIYEKKELNINLTNITQKYFFDYNLQKKLSIDEKTWAIYSAFAFRGYRSKKVEKVKFISIIAYLFSKFIYLINIPRLIKLKFFPGLGKQNYT